MHTKTARRIDRSGLLKAGFLRAMVIGAVGVGAFWALSLPLPFLLGPMFACLAAALADIRMSSPSLIGVLMRTVIGTAAGASITPDIVDRAGDFIASLALVPMLVAAAALIGMPYFQRLAGLDRKTAFYAAMPGGLQDMVALGEEAGADVRALALAHATRVFALVSAAPFVLWLIWSVDLASAPGVSATEIALIDVVLLIACAIGGWKIAERLKLFGASVIGPMIAAAALSLTDVLHSRPPAEAILAAQFFIGLAVGVRYVGVTKEEIRRVIVATLGYCVVLCAMAAAAAAALVWLDAAPALEAFLAFAPGGQGEMIVLGILAGADVAYVATIHIFRVAVVILSAGVVSGLIGVR